MFGDDLEDEVRVNYRKFAPSIVILACLLIIEAPILITIAVPVFFGVLGWFYIADSWRMKISYLLIIATIVWSVLPSDLKQSLISRHGVAVSAENVPQS